MKKSTIVILLAVLLIVMLAACAPGDGKATVDNPANFLWGIWHGWIAPVTLIIQLFNKSIRIYETINTGWWYDFGFYLAVVGGFGGLAIFRRRKRRHKSE
ncbi:MAG: hypothetical protein R3232_10645 [Clostridia bacterium]|nr:hypothetical protein [Clostridia bacterium]